VLRTYQSGVTTCDAPRLRVDEAARLAKQCRCLPREDDSSRCSKRLAQTPDVDADDEMAGTLCVPAISSLGFPLVRFLYGSVE
jgi:hypothetical protein